MKKEKRTFTRTQRILRDLINKKYKKDPWGKKKFLKILAVDIDKVVPIDFAGCKYSNSLNKEDLFLFLDKDLRIMGILKGNEYDHKRYYDFISSEYCKYGSNDLPKNWKNLQPKAHIILQFPDATRTWRAKPEQNNQKGGIPLHIQKLNARLKEYKLKKYQSLTHGEYLDMITKTYNYLVSKLFVPKEEQQQIFERVRSIYSFSVTYMDEIIRAYSERSKDYMWRYENYTKCLKVHGVEYAKYEEKNLNEYKVEILTWYNILVKSDTQGTPKAA